MKSRIFNIMQYEKHPETKEPLLSEEKIEEALAHKTIKRWAWIAHDQDVYSEADEVANADHKAGNTKPKHFHIVIEMKSNQVEIGVIARWFGIADNFVNVAKGAGAFLDCVQYLTHEREEQQYLGKRLYPDGCVKSNFDFRSELDKRAERKALYGKEEISQLDMWLSDILDGKMSERDCLKSDKVLYAHNINIIRQNRKAYLMTKTPPKTRINIYVGAKRKDGTSGGVGKSLASRAIARQLIHSQVGHENDPDEEIFFEVGAKNVTFEGYDGQPVIIWNDCKAMTLLEKLGDRENVYNVFDTHPSTVIGMQNIKNAFIPLCQTFNIINSSQSPEEFLDALSGEYIKKNGEKVIADDKSQVRRRIVITLFLHEEDYDYAFNKGFFNDTDDFYDYEYYKGICGNFQQVRSRLSEKQALQIESRMTKCIAEKANEKVEIESNRPDAEEAVFSAYSMGYGKTKDEQMKDLLSMYNELGQLSSDIEKQNEIRDDITVNELRESQLKLQGIFSTFLDFLAKSGLKDSFLGHIQDKIHSEVMKIYYDEEEEKTGSIPIPGYEDEERIKAIEKEVQEKYNMIIPLD